MTDPLGQSQVIPYLAGLSDKGFSISIISCEKKKAFENLKNIISAKLSSANVRWHPIMYHRMPPVLSTLWDMIKIYFLAVRLFRIYDFDIIHCRSYVPSLIGMKLKKRFGKKMIFDMRGFWADERVEGKTWNLHNPLFKIIYHYFKRAEKQLIEQSDHIISLTESGRKVIESWNNDLLQKKRITVIPCCCDIDLFNPEFVKPDRKLCFQRELGISPDAPVITYLGAIGTCYLLKEMLTFFKCFRIAFPGSRFLFITQHDANEITNAAISIGIGSSEIIVIAAQRDDVPVLLSLGTLSVYFIRPGFARLASSPTKQAEIMAMGIPVITNKGIGDSDEIIKKQEAGILIDGFTDIQFQKAIEEFRRKNFDANQIRNAAIALFDLKSGIEKYYIVYQSLLMNKAE